MADDLKYRQKYKDLRKRIREIEEENDVLNVRLYKARKSIRHLKLERTFLLDRMEKTTHPSLDDHSDNSDVGSDIYSHDESDMLLHKLSHASNNGASGGGGKHGNRMEKLIVNKPQRKKKDPNAPKGPGNVFFLYCRLERDKMKDEHPTENLGEVTRLLGQRWKGLTKDEKKKYYDMYKQELEEFEEAMKTYTANGGSATRELITAPSTAGEDNLDVNDVSNMSSPALSNEVSMDMPSDPIPYEDDEKDETHDSPDVGSFMDEDDEDQAAMYQQQQQQQDPNVMWQPNTADNHNSHHHEAE